MHRVRAVFPLGSAFTPDNPCSATGRAARGVEARRTPPRSAGVDTVGGAQRATNPSTSSVQHLEENIGRRDMSWTTTPGWNSTTRRLADVDQSSVR